MEIFTDKQDISMHESVIRKFAYTYTGISVFLLKCNEKFEKKINTIVAYLFVIID